MSDSASFSLGAYLVGPRIATGGMGEVYVALKRGVGGFRKPVALKLLLPHLSEDAEMVRMFLDEARLAAQMRHPNVVEIYDVGVESGRHYIAMELVHGVALSTLLRRSREAGEKLDASLVSYVGRALCDGLHHAHQLLGTDGKPLEVVHRDVSPQNVLVSTDGHVKLTDFGIARARDSRGRTEPGTVKGKFAYLAPEQLNGASVDRRADVYAAAVTLFEMATGVSPFRRETDAMTFDAARNEPLPSLRALRPDLPEPLEAALARGAMKDPATRCATALQLRELLPVPSSSASAELSTLVTRHGAGVLSIIEAQTASFVEVATRATGAPVRSPGTWRIVTAAASIAAVVTIVFGAMAARWWWPEPIPPPARISAAALPDPAPAQPEPEPESEPQPDEPSPPVRTGTAKPSPKPKGTGYLSVDAVPWASVYLGDKKIGDTPIDHFPVPAGVVSLVFKGPPDTKSVTRRVTIAAGKPVFLKVDLRK